MKKIFMSFLGVFALMVSSFVLASSDVKEVGFFITSPVYAVDTVGHDPTIQSFMPENSGCFVENNNINMKSDTTWRQPQKTNVEIALVSLLCPSEHVSVLSPRFTVDAGVVSTS